MKQITKLKVLHPINNKLMEAKLDLKLLLTREEELQDNIPVGVQYEADFKDTENNVSNLEDAIQLVSKAIKAVESILAEGA